MQIAVAVAELFAVQITIVHRMKYYAIPERYLILAGYALAVPQIGDCTVFPGPGRLKVSGFYE